tara:strand:+ start:11199 stop:11549 length:351 start_codon:yes stop_codon:yes gene_type:complete
MLVIQQPRNKFTKVSRQVLFNKELSLGAKVLYSTLCSLKPGQNYTDNYLIKALDISKPTLTRWKAELKKEDLVLIKQVHRNVFFTFVGLPDYPASRLYAEYQVHKKILEEGEVFED